MIEVHIDGDLEAARAVVSAVPGVNAAECRDDALLVESADGPAIISRVALALSGADLNVRTLTLRTPTLDDVFLRVTGHHIRPEEAV